ncbi:MAG TPA: hypothetical protein VHD37_02625 [Candidatus Paceibacterota bacterium]|nr:hypothetical protein [Candidatus Paceibacterota bacterium]
MTRVLITLASLGVLASFALTLLWGLKARWNENMRRAVAIGYHRRWARRTFAVVVAAVLLVEAAVRLGAYRGMGSGSGFVFHWVHLPAAAAGFLLLVAMHFRYTGVRYPRFHKWLAYPCLASFGIAGVTGVGLAWV